MTSVCPCQFCSKAIEFSSDCTGQTIACPHCGLDTVLFMQAKIEPVSVMESEQVNDPKAESEPSQKTRISLLTPSLLFLIGCGLIVNGCSVEQSATGAIHQVYAAVNYCTGLLLIAASFILNALRNIANNQ